MLTNGLVSSGPLLADPNILATFDCGLVLGSNQSFSIAAPITLNGTLDLSGHTLMIDNSSAVTLSGPVMNSGDTLIEEFIEKTNVGTLTISSNVEFIDPGRTITFELNDGMLVMDGSATNSVFFLDGGTMVLDGNVFQAETQVSNSVISGTGSAETLDGLGTFIPGDGGNTGILSCNNFNGALSSAPPSSALDIIINSTTPGSGYSQLLVSNSYVLSAGVNRLSAVLDVELNFASQIGDSFLVLRQLSGKPYNPAPDTGNGFFTGQPNNSIFDTTNGDSLATTYDTNGITLTTIRTPNSPFVLWKGSGNTTNLVYGSRRWSSTNNWAQGVIPTNGSQIIVGPYEFSLFNNPVPPMTNDLPENTSFNSLTMNVTNHSLYGTLTVTGGITNNASSGTNFCYADLVTVEPLSIAVAGGGTLLLSNSFNGSASVYKEGAGRMIYTGTTMDSFVGTVIIDAGIMQMNGVFTDGSFLINGGLLSGTGTVSSLDLNGGTLRPGNSPGILHLEGNLTMAPGAVFEAELNSPIPGSGYDQLQVSGDVSLNGATLNLQPGYVAAPGSAFLVIANNGTDPVSGTFANLPEGAIFESSGQFFSITYRAGLHGNNVVVTAANPPGNLIRILPLNSTNMLLQGAGASNTPYTIQAATNLTTTNWQTIGSAFANSFGSFFFSDTNAELFPQRFYRALNP